MAVVIITYSSFGVISLDVINFAAVVLLTVLLFASRGGGSQPKRNNSRRKKMILCMASIFPFCEAAIDQDQQPQ